MVSYKTNIFLYENKRGRINQYKFCNEDIYYIYMDGGAILHGIPSEQYLQILLNNPTVVPIGYGVYSNTFILTLPEPNIIVGFYPGISLTNYNEINKVLVKIVSVIDRNEPGYTRIKKFPIVETETFLDEVNKQLDIYEKTNMNLEPLCPKILHSVIMDYKNKNDISIIDKLINIDTRNKQFNTHGIIFMEYIEGSITQEKALTLNSRNTNTIKNIHISFMYEYKRLINAGYIHGDLHANNVLFVPDYKYTENYNFRLVFIDFMQAIPILPDKIPQLIEYFETGTYSRKLFNENFIDTNITNEIKENYIITQERMINYVKNRLSSKILFIIKIFANSFVFLEYTDPVNPTFMFYVKEMEKKRKTQIEFNLKHMKTGDIPIRDKNFTMTRTDNGNFLFTQTNPVAMNPVEEPVAMNPVEEPGAMNPVEEPVAINPVEEPVAINQNNRSIDVDESEFQTSNNYDRKKFAVTNFKMYKIVTDGTIENINIKDEDKKTNPILNNWKHIRDILTKILNYLIDNPTDEEEEYNIYKELYKIEELQNSIQVYKGVIKAMSTNSKATNSEYRIDYDSELEKNMNSKIIKAFTQINGIVKPLLLKLKRV